MRNNALKSRPYILATLLLTALACLVGMLLFWGQQTVDLRKELFLDKAKLAVRDVVKTVEDNRYCFSMYADFEIPPTDSFALENPFLAGNNGPIPFYYYGMEGRKVEMPRFPLIGEAFMQMSLRFEFKDVPGNIDMDKASDFEKYIKEVYDRSLVDSRGKRLADLEEIDSLLRISLTAINPDVLFNYSIREKEGEKLMYVRDEKADLGGLHTINAPLFEGEADIEALVLSVNFLNLGDLFYRDKWMVYTSSTLLALVSFALIFILVGFYLHQKRLLQRQKDFVHGMTHEFNTPISNISLSAQKLSKSADADVRKVAGILEMEGKKLQAGINLVMTAALIEKDELLMQREEIDVRNLLEDTLEKNRTLLAENGIELSIKISKGEYEISGDSFHLENVFQNMINNVRRHSHANLLEITTERVNGHIDICFSDNGIGIPEEFRPRIFDKFESRGNNGRKNGYGLGLYYSRMILEMHGGNIGLLNGQKAGSKFSIQIPT